jgi:Flp pilus assembly protein TadD
MKLSRIQVLLLSVLIQFGCSIGSQVDPVVARTKVEQMLASARDNMRLNSRESRARASAQLEIAYSLQPASPAVLDALGCLEWQNGRIAEAEAFFNRALIADPLFDPTYVNLAVIAEGRGNPNQARELLRRAIEINPLNYKARNNFASLLYDYAYSSADEKVAYQELLKAVESAPALDNTLRYNLKKFKSSNTLSPVRR